ncbi:MAG TPA: hypothetical protein VL501_06450 [Pyrinomonadaceae bacterium]|nr:hypothetical protein [Pyrinomonadaceae bacterium]
MKKKLAILTLLASSLLVFLPPVTQADAQIRVQIGGRHTNRGLHRGWYRGRHVGWYKHSRPGYLRQVYYINGRRYVRYVRY